MTEELIRHLVAYADIYSRLGQLELCHSLKYQPGDLVCKLFALLVHAAEGDVGKERTGSCTLLTGDCNKVFTLTDLEPESTEELCCVLSCDLALFLVLLVVGVKELVDAAGGTIECISNVNEGTEFTVRMPQRLYNVKDQENEETRYKPSRHRSCDQS